MAQQTDNLDDMLQHFVKLERAAELEVIRESRKKMTAIMKKLKPAAKKATPEASGTLKKSIRVQSRSKRGRTNIRLLWKIVTPKSKDSESESEEKSEKPKLVNYSGVVNFKKGQSAEGFASKLWAQKKASIDEQGAKVVIETMNEVLKKNGIKVK